MQFFPVVSLRSVFDTIMESSAIQNGMKRAEERNQNFGRIFGILSLFRSTRFLNDPPTEETREIVEKCIEEILRLYNQKRWLHEICVQTLNTVLRSSHPGLTSLILKCSLPLFRESRVDDNNEVLLIPIPLNPSSLLYLLEVQLFLHGKDLQFDDEEVERTFVKNAEVTPHHLCHLMSVYQGSTFTYPTIHPLWPVSIEYIRVFAEDPEDSLMSWWDAVTTQVLSSSPERQGLACRWGVMHRVVLKVCRSLFPLVSTASLSRLLNKATVQLIRSVSGNSKNYLHKQALHLLNFFVTVLTGVAYHS